MDKEFVLQIVKRTQEWLDKRLAEIEPDNYLEQQCVYKSAFDCMAEEIKDYLGD